MDFTDKDRARFESKIYPEPNSGCWLWDGGIGRGGYGRFAVGRKTLRAHRVSYELHVGAVPRGEGHHGTCVLHKCDNPPCVNPAHLFLGTNSDNTADRHAKGRDAKGDRSGRRTRPDRTARGSSMHATRNTASGARHGWHTMPERCPRGERNGSAKLTDAQVATIREQFAHGMSRKDLSILWQTPFGTICDFISGRSRAGRPRPRVRS